MLKILSKMCERATSELGVKFLDLDHDSPIDFGRLQRNEKRLVHQPFLCMRVRYEPQVAAETNDVIPQQDALLIYCQMAITENDPIEIQQIRSRFPKFPDEPTTNQFYTPDQVAAYRLLGYHIGSRVCAELERWNPNHAKQAEQSLTVQEKKFDSRAWPITTDMETLIGRGNRKSETDKKVSPDSYTNVNRQPGFKIIENRLRTAYRLACHEELSYRPEDILSEAVWEPSDVAFPTVAKEASWLFEFVSKRLTVVRGEPARPRPTADASDLWLSKYQSNADLRAAYRWAVVHDTNRLNSDSQSYCEKLFVALWGDMEITPTRQFQEAVFAAHLAAIAIACQEIHRGRPHAAFQIGGRHKLISLVASISREFGREIHESDEPATIGANVTSSLLCEILELQRSVFQGASRPTTVSFTQCCVALCANVARKELDVASIRIDDLLLRWLDDTPDLGDESNQIEFRRLVSAAVKEDNATNLSSSLLKYWHANYVRPGEIKSAKLLRMKEKLGLVGADNNEGNSEATKGNRSTTSS